MKTTTLISLVAATLPPLSEGLAVAAPSARPTQTAVAKVTTVMAESTALYMFSPQRQNKRNASAAVTPLVAGSSVLLKKARKHQSASKPVTKVPRTESFSALWSGTLLIPTTDLAAPVDVSVVDVIKPHTLILGTHPSISSLAKEEYYAHPLNAFWWIAGDCLGFRRNTGISPTTGDAYKFTRSLRSNNGNQQGSILNYNQQLERLVTSGFALWDVVASCQRAGSSLDQDIRDEIPNDVMGFCRAHPSIRRIVLANGGTGSRMFVKHFADWLASGQLLAAPSHEASQKAFGPAIRRLTKKKKKRNKDSVFSESTEGQQWTSSSTITLVSAISVSPAAARFSYAQKRDFWDAHVYSPGLALRENGDVSS